MSTFRSVSYKVYVPLVLVALLGLGLSASAFVVRIDQYAIVIQFGEPVRTLQEPGIYFRVPFMQRVEYFDARIMEWDDTPQMVMTNDKKRIHINSFARWRIADPLQFLRAVRNEEGAQLSLDKILGRTVRDVVSAHAIDEVVRNTNRPLTYATEVSEKAKKTMEIPLDSGRSKLVTRIYNDSQAELLETFGILLIDIQIKQLNYTRSARQQVIKEMNSERMVVVESYESDGKREQERIRGEVDERLQQLQAEANQRRLELEGEGQAQAIAIKSAAFQQDPELYQFLETLRIYEESFDERTTLVLSSDNPLLHLLQGPGTPPALPVAP